MISLRSLKRNSCEKMSETNNSKQAMWVAIGQFLSYAIGIVTPMILSRYFDKGDYGTYKQVMYVYSTLLTVFSFGLPRAYSYFIPRVSMGESKDVVKKITGIFIILGLIFSAILFFGAHIIAVILKNTDLELALKYFSPTPLFLLPVMGLDSIMAAYKKTQFIAVYSVTTKVLTIFLIILPVILFNGSYIHAIIGFDIASLISFLLALYLRNLPTKDIPLEKTSVTIKEIFLFALPLMTASIWIMIFNSANQFFISRYYGNEIFAEFSNGFIEFPIVPMVVSSVATVLLPLFSGMVLQNKEKIKTVWTNALTKSIKIIYPMSMFCIFFANVIMSCFFGKQYENSGIYFVIKNFDGFFTVIPFYPIILALGKTKQYSNVHLVMAIAIIPLEYLVVLLGLPAYVIGIVFILCCFIKVVLQYLIVAKSTNMKAIDLIPFGTILKISGLAAIAAILPFVAVRINSGLNHFVLLAIATALYFICYYIICWVGKVSYKDVLSGYLSNNKFSFIMKYIP